MDEATLETVRACLKQAPIRAPQPGDRVYKDECMFSFDTPLSAGGLYLNLSTWQSFGEAYVELDHTRTGNKLYLWEVARKVPLTAEEAAKAREKPEKMAIGGDGGFQVGTKNFSIEKEQRLVILPENLRIPLPAPELPEMILNTLAAVQEHESASAQDAAAAWEETRVESKHAATLVQLEQGMGKHGRSIPSDPKLWACDETGVTENLWLNLSTGFIGSGRQNWDGSGGNGAAERHFEATGRQYPLVVKLGTITPHGADVFSYGEDDMVTDSKLAEHLAHWGINMMGMQKTEKTMAELQIDLNMSYEHDRITESGSLLAPLSGPGYVGLTNLGNSCYMNSVLQLLCQVPGLRQRYVTASRRIFETAPADPATDFPSQMAKVAAALLEGRTESPVPLADESDSAAPLTAKPQAFKRLVGKGHPEFSTSRQQDASEYLQFLLEVMSRAERTLSQRLAAAAAPGHTAGALEFSIETRVQCGESGRVSYKRDAPTNILSLNIPMEAAANLNEVEQYQEREAKRAKLRESNAEAYIQQDNGDAQASKAISSASQEEKVLPRVPLGACLQKWAGEEEMGDYFSAALGRKTNAAKRLRLANFPPFLVLQLNRFYLASDWTAKKLEVLVDVPEELHLGELRGTGLQPGEEAQPEGPTAAAPAPQPAALQPDPHIVEALMATGFSENGSKRAAVATQNGGTEASMEWVLSHMEDPDFNDPLPSGSAQEEYAANPESVSMLISMGFTPRQAAAALKACQGSLERAGDWLFSHATELDTAVTEVLEPAAAAKAEPQATGPAAGGELQDGEGRYRLVGFVSHVGANTACGHYVCHLFKDDRWAIFNDEKVAVSEHPPKELGYLYLFQRADTF